MMLGGVCILAQTKMMLGGVCIVQQKQYAFLISCFEKSGDSMDSVHVNLKQTDLTLISDYQYLALCSISQKKRYAHTIQQEKRQHWCPVMVYTAICVWAYLLHNPFNHLTCYQHTAGMHFPCCTLTHDHLQAQTTQLTHRTSFNNAGSAFHCLRPIICSLSFLYGPVIWEDRRNACTCSNEPSRGSLLERNWLG